MKIRYRGLFLSALLLASVFALAACGGDDDDDSDAREESSTETTEATDEAENPSATAESPEDEDTGEASATGTETDAADDEETPTPTPEDADEDDEQASASGDGGCSVTVSGALDASWEGPDDDSAILTDYWMTDAEKREIIRVFNGMAEDGSELTDEEIDATVESGEPIFGMLLMNCTSSSQSEGLTFTTSSDATREDFPQGPGTYAIAGDAFGPTTESNQISVLGVFDSDSLYSVTEGTFEITAWDNSKIEGTFNYSGEEMFATEEPAGQIEVEGTFSFTCKGLQGCD